MKFQAIRKKPWYYLLAFCQQPNFPSLCMFLQFLVPTFSSNGPGEWNWLLWMSGLPGCSEEPVESYILLYYDCFSFPIENQTKQSNFLQCILKLFLSYICRNFFFLHLFSSLAYWLFYKHISFIFCWKPMAWCYIPLSTIGLSCSGPDRPWSSGRWLVLAILELSLIPRVFK